jgi:hypothetical protein
MFDLITADVGPLICNDGPVQPGPQLLDCQILFLQHRTHLIKAFLHLERSLGFSLLQSPNYFS